MLRGSLDGRGVWGRMDTCMCVPQSLYCSPKTITLLVSVMLQYKTKMYFLIVLNSQSGIINKGKQATFTQIAPWDFRGLQRCVSLPWLRLWPKAAGQLLTEWGAHRNPEEVILPPPHTRSPQVGSIILKTAVCFPAIQSTSSGEEVISCQEFVLGIPVIGNSNLGSPMVTTRCLRCQRPGFNLWSEN